MPEALKARSEIPVPMTWDLSRLYPSDAACKAAVQELVQASADFQARYKGQLQTAEAPLLIAATRDYEKLCGPLHRCNAYASFRFETDMTDSEALKQMQQVEKQSALVEANTSFFTDELAKASAAALRQAQEDAPQYRHFFQDIVDWQPHMLPPEQELLLAKLGPTLNLPSSIYEISKASDTHFPDFTVAGKKYPLSYTLYESNYCEDPHTPVRREAFRVFSKTLADYRNTTATAYNAQVQKEKTIATLRGFDSVFDYLLFHQKVSREQYEQHLDTTMERLAPIMRRWARLLEKSYQLGQIHYADLKLNLDPRPQPPIQVEDAPAFIEKAVAPMGQDYHDTIMRFVPERWVDYLQNVGKSTGGFCDVPPEAGPFILTNWNYSYSELDTLAHELGHAMQGIITQRHNTLLEADFTWYDVESPSTFHELLLNHALLSEARAAGDRERERFYLAALIEKTYYHNFVTHFLEGYYQREVYRLVDQGQDLSADDFDRLFRGTLEKFWGDTVLLDEGAERTWMRQPHYYNGLYSYTYSCSLVISTEMYQRLAAGDPQAPADWLKFLATGGPLAPVEHARVAGIDISGTAALERTIDFIGSIITELEKA